MIPSIILSMATIAAIGGAVLVARGNAVAPNYIWAVSNLVIIAHNAIIGEYEMVALFSAYEAIALYGVYNHRRNRS